MNRIESVDKLAEMLLQSAPKEYVSIAELLCISAADLKKYAHWKTKGYARNCIERTEDFELLLLCWNPGDGTPIHCHGEQRCWVYQVNGEMEEVLYKENFDGDIEMNVSQKLEAGAISYMDDSLGYHTLKNNTSTPCMSLHLYAKPIDSCTYYDKKVDAFIPKNMRYHSYKGTLLHPSKIKTPTQKISNFTE